MRFVKKFVSYCSLLCMIALLSSPVSSADERPNVLLIVADDMGYSDLGLSLIHI